MPEPIRQTLLDHDLSPRIAVSTTVVASPSAAVETIIASVSVPSFGDVPIVSGVLIYGWAGFTVGTAGISGKLTLRQTSVAGTIVTTGPAVTMVAANVEELSLIGFDSGAGASVYKLTLTVASANAASTVSVVGLVAIPV